MGENNSDDRKKFFLWLGITIVWWLSPLDDSLEAFLGSFCLTDEVLLTIMTLYKGFRLFLGINCISGAKHYGKKFSNTITEDEKIAKAVNAAVDTVIDTKLSQLGTAEPLHKSNKAESVKDMNLF